MTTITRIADSCLLVTADDGTTLFDPGAFAFSWEGIDLSQIGDVQQILITHEHADHVSAEFVNWVIDRGEDVRVYANDAVIGMLADSGIAASAAAPHGFSSEDGLHAPLPNGATPPNRSWTIDSVITHPGDSYDATSSAPVLALPLVTPWGTMHASIGFAQRLGPAMVVPIHDFYLSTTGRAWVTKLASGVLGSAGIDLVNLDPGDSFSV